MEVGECVLSAARAVLDLLEREWQPLSAGELEQRLDQAVEEILEAELMAGLKARPPPASRVQPPQNRAGVQPRGPAASTCGPPEEGTPEAPEARPDVGAAAVKVPACRRLSHLKVRDSLTDPHRVHHTCFFFLLNVYVILLNKTRGNVYTSKGSE